MFGQSNSDTMAVQKESVAGQKKKFVPFKHGAKAKPFAKVPRAFGTDAPDDGLTFQKIMGRR